MLIDELQNESYRSLSDFNEKELAMIKAYRWKARYDAKFLGTKILRMDGLIKDFTHGPLLNHLQKFPRPTRETAVTNDQLLGGQWVYRPLIRDVMKLEGPRDRLILQSRGSGKTTINCELHTIQWLINYPDIAIAIFQASRKKACDILEGIKRHFTENALFRTVFPEFCPPPDQKDFGTQESFTTPARALLNKRSRREDSVMANALESGLTGYHFEVLKFTDIVVPDNITTAEQIQKIKDLFDITKYQRISSETWRDVEGTIYHFDDLYCDIIKQYEKDIKDHGKSRWSVFIRGIWVKDTPEPKYTPEEMFLPNKLDENGKRVSIFPEWFPTEGLEADEAANKHQFKTQMEMVPSGGDQGREFFPDIEKRVITAAQFRQSVNPAYNVVMIDTAHTQGQDSNSSVILQGTVDRFGRLYIRGANIGKWLPNELYTKIVAVCDLDKPAYLVMEKSPFNEGLLPAIRREWDLFPHFIPDVKLVPIDNQKRKQQKIKECLEPAYARSDYRFVRDWIKEEDWARIVHEHRAFPNTLQDDVLDALTAFYECRTWFGREFDRNLYPAGMSPQEYAFKEMLGFPNVDFDRVQQPADILNPAGLNEYYKRTGGL
jgi:hypothetical protein